MKKNGGDFDAGLFGMLWMGLMTICNYGIQLISIYFLSRLLSPSDYGQFAALAILIGLADLFWMMGVGPAIVQIKDISRADIITANTLNILFGLVVFLIVNTFASYWAEVFNISDVYMLRVYSFIFILNSISGVSQSLTQRRCKFKEISIIKSLSIIIYGAGAIALAFFNLGSWSLVYATVLQTVFIATVFIIYEPIPFQFSIKKESASRLLYFGGGLTASKFFNYVAIRGDSFIVNKVMGKTELGLFSRAQQLLLFPVSLVGDTLDQVLFPLLSRCKEDREKLRRVFLNGTGTIALLSVPIAIVAFFRANELIGFFLGDKWGATVDPFKIMIIGLFFRTGYKLSDSLIRALGKVYQGATIQGIYAILVISGAYVGHFYGLTGVAIGVTIAFTVHYLLLTGMSMYLVKIKAKDILGVLFPAVLYGSLTTIAMLVANSFISNVVNNFVTCVVSTIYVFFIYGVLFIALKNHTMTKDFTEFIFALINRLSIVKRKSKGLKEVNA